MLLQRTQQLGALLLQQLTLQHSFLLLLMENEEETVQEREEERQRPVRRYRRRTIWVQDWLKERPLHGAWANLIPTLAGTSKPTYRNTFRMDEEMFNEILERVRPHIEKKVTFCRKPIQPGLRLAITLRFLATGDSYRSLALLFRVHQSTICKIIYETCDAIIAEYLDNTIVCPSTPEEWKEVADGFAERWNFEHTLGAIDGKHIRITSPHKSGSYYFNYKGYTSIVMLAVVDSNYKFRYVSVGANGASSDSQVFTYSNLHSAIVNNELGLPQRECLHNDDRPLPYFLVGDDAFALKDWMMKPYPFRGLTYNQRVFNYRLSRARRVVENAFGILANR